MRAGIREALTVDVRPAERPGDKALRKKILEWQ
jgi:hypothetical protein